MDKRQERTRISSLAFFIKDWWKSRGESKPAPNEVARVIGESSHTGGGRTPTTTTEALEQMADGADDYLSSFD